MKSSNIINCLAAAVVLTATACVKEYAPIDIYHANTGEEYLNVSEDTLSFSGRGGELTFIADASYDATISVSAGWATPSTQEIPGDRRKFTVTVSAPTNRGEGAADRECTITISTRNLTETIVVLQPLYNRPVDPEAIVDAETFKYWFETCAAYYEEGEVMNILSDINLKDVSVAPIAEFKGTLNGNGFSINNFKSESPLILVNRGNVNDLTVAASCEFTVPESAIYFSPFVGENYGTISGCVNNAPVAVTGNRTVKTYLGGMAAYHYAGAVITGCKNCGSLTFSPESASENAYMGGICGYSYGDVTRNDNYGSINGTPAAFNAVYFIGGITPRHETGILSYNINHKEARIYTNEISKASKSYIGGIAGYMKGAPVTTANEVYSDIEINLTYKDVYVGGLQGWQERVTSGEATLFESSIVNSRISVYTTAKGQYGNNPCMSAGFVTGRFSGQSGYSTLHYGNESDPIKVSGSITSLANGATVVSSAKDYKNLLCGDGSKSSANGGGISEADYNTILYEVRGDGQKGDPEDLIIKGGEVKLSVPAEGGDASFSVRGNYTITVTPQVEWLSVDVTTVDGDNKFYDVKVTAGANPKTSPREGQIHVTMPMGSTEIVTITQDGNMTIPESLEVNPASIGTDPAGTESSAFTVTANYPATITADAEWIKFSPATVEGDELPHEITVLCDKNQSGAERSGSITVTLTKGMTATVAVNQAKFEYKPKAEIGNVADFLDFMVYGNDAQLYPSTFEVKLTADIDLKGQTVGMIDQFSGWFNGQGHCLKNIKSDVPVFGINKGKIENLVLDGSCAFTLDLTKAPSSTSAIWAGALCGNADPGTISGCTNKASVTVTDTPAKDLYLGGVVGRTADAGSDIVVNCTNEGSISVKPASTVTVEIRIGGIVGSCNSNIIGCVNNAPIEFAPADINGKRFDLAGVAAYLPQNRSMTGCTNRQKGIVSFNPKACTNVTNGANVAGLVGRIKASSKLYTIDNCANFGDIKTTANAATVGVGGLIGFIEAGKAGLTVLTGCTVNCNISAVTTGESINGSTNTLTSAGLVIGYKKAVDNPDGVTCIVGSSEKPVKVAGTIAVNGGAATELTSENYTNYLIGNTQKSNLFGGSTKYTFNTTYEAVTKE